jgi:predicted RNA-binding protein with RPS1 domain
MNQNVSASDEGRGVQRSISQQPAAFRSSIVHDARVSANEAVLNKAGFSIDEIAEIRDRVPDLNVKILAPKSRDTLVATATDAIAVSKQTHSAVVFKFENVLMIVGEGDTVASVSDAYDAHLSTKRASGKDDQGSYTVGDPITGRIVGRERAGRIIVEIAPGIEAILFEKGRHKIGDEIDLIISRVKSASKGEIQLVVERDLSKKRDWDRIEELNPIGLRQSATVTRIMGNGTLVRLASGFPAYLHKEEISWTERRPNIQKLVQSGQKLAVVVTQVDAEQGRITVSHRQTLANPWSELLETCPIGAQIIGKVSNLSDFGLFIELPNGCVGLMHKKFMQAAQSGLKVGDMTTVIIESYDAAARRISLVPSAEDGAI